MTISEIDEEVTDYDWFAVDREGRIGHFTTGGIGTLPRSVAASGDDLQLLADFFSTLPPSTEAIFAPRARIAANNANWRKGIWGPLLDAEAAIAHCFQDFMQMANRGLYSFDHSYALDRGVPRERPCPLYYRIAIPSNPLNVTDLPVNVQTILNRHVLAKAAFAHDDEVYVE